jgi:hypothetical protein
VAPDRENPRKGKQSHCTPPIIPEYIFSGLFKFKVTEKSGKLYVQYPVFGDEPLELLPESETRFFTTQPPFVIEFEKEANGSVNKAKAGNGPEASNGEKVADAPE